MPHTHGFRKQCHQGLMEPIPSYQHKPIISCFSLDVCHQLFVEPCDESGQMLQKWQHACCHFFGFSCPVEHWPTWAESPCGKHEGLNCKFISNSNTWAHYTTWAHSPTSALHCSVKLFKVCYKLCFCTWCCLLLFSCVQPTSCFRWLQPVALFYLPHPPVVWSSHIGSSQGPDCKLTIPVSSYPIAVIPYNFYTFYQCCPWYPCNHSYHLYHSYR